LHEQRATTTTTTTTTTTGSRGNVAIHRRRTLIALIFKPNDRERDNDLTNRRDRIPRLHPADASERCEPDDEISCSTPMRELPRALNDRASDVFRLRDLIRRVAPSRNGT